MLNINVEFLHDTMRASPADDAAMTGLAERGEWPPSPARLFSAFVAADGTRERCRFTTGDELRLLEGDAPVIEADRRPWFTVLNGRFVVIDARDDNTTQNYAGRQAQLIRPGVRTSFADPRVRYCWPNVEPTDGELRALRLRAARVGYLGCSDSPVRVTVSDEVVAWSDERAYVPDDAGPVVLPVAYPGFREALDAGFDRWSTGEALRRSWIPSRHIRYRNPGPGRPSVVEAPQSATIWLRFDRAVGGRRVLLVAETLFRATLEHYARRFGDDAVPEVLHGHHAAGAAGVEHVRWLPLPFVGHPHADGRIRGACVWLPAGTDPTVVERVRGAVHAIDRLVCPGVFDVAVRPFDGIDQPWSTNPRRWQHASTRFVSAFPVVHERYTKGRVSAEEVARWCAYAGLPEPVRFVSEQVPLVEGAVTLSASEAFRSGRDRRPFSHFRLEFAESLRGPLTLGRYRHFGLGLLVPEAER